MGNKNIEWKESSAFWHQNMIIGSVCFIGDVTYLKCFIFISVMKNIVLLFWIFYSLNLPMLYEGVS